MLETMMVSSGSVMYVMAAVGILGVLAKIVNRMTLYRLIKAAGNMPKSTHKLMKLVRQNTNMPVWRMSLWKMSVYL